MTRVFARCHRETDTVADLSMMLQPRDRKLAIQQPASGMLGPLLVKFLDMHRQPREQIALGVGQEGKY
jgi:hypothetical protein